MNKALIWSRIAIGICAAAVGFYAAYAAYKNGASMAPGFDGQVFGVAFAAVVAGSWFLLSLASRAPSWGVAWLMRLGWAACLAFVLINALGFTAGHRGAKTAAASSSIASYDSSLAGLSEARSRLSSLTTNPRWVATNGCSNATVDQSKEYCSKVADAQGDVKRYQHGIEGGRPASSDAQADVLSWMTGVNADTVSKALPVMMALVLDIAASLFVWAALMPYAEAVKSAPVEVTAPLKKKRKKPAAKGVKLAVANGIRIARHGQVDRRFKASRAANA